MVTNERETVLSLRNVRKAYAVHGGGGLEVLKGVSFEVMAGETVSIVGPSGSGKTTLLGICAGLDGATQGEVVLCGRSLTGMTEDERAAVRGRNIGFVFQNFQLLQSLTALENVMVPLELRGERGAREKALELLAKVGLADRSGHYPVQLSGGEQQRVALARAFINEPKLLFADEPTGNLDADTSDPIEHLLFELNQTAGTTLVLVTHDLSLAEKTERVFRMQGGSLLES